MIHILDPYYPGAPMATPKGALGMGALRVFLHAVRAGRPSVRALVLSARGAQGWVAGRCPNARLEEGRVHVAQCTGAHLRAGRFWGLWRCKVVTQ